MCSKGKYHRLAGIMSRSFRWDEFTCTRENLQIGSGVKKNKKQTGRKARHVGGEEQGVSEGQSRG